MCVHVVFFCTYDALPVPPPKLGFSFELTYFDDPQSYLPSSCVNWVTTTGKCRGVHMLTQTLSMDWGIESKTIGTALVVATLLT